MIDVAVSIEIADNPGDTQTFDVSGTANIHVSDPCDTAVMDSIIFEYDGEEITELEIMDCWDGTVIDPCDPVTVTF